jgi:hypothetical protein
LAAINGTALAAWTAVARPTSVTTNALQPVIARLNTLTVRVDELIATVKKLTATAEKSTAADKGLATGIARLTLTVAGLSGEGAEIRRPPGRPLPKTLLCWGGHMLSSPHATSLLAIHLTHDERGEIVRSLIRIHHKCLAQSVNNADSEPLPAFTVDKAAEKGKEDTAAEGCAGEEGPVEEDIRE